MAFQSKSILFRHQFTHLGVYETTKFASSPGMLSDVSIPIRKRFLFANAKVHILCREQSERKKAFFGEDRVISHAKLKDST